MITATGPRVPGCGPSPCEVMLVGEGPGYDEAVEGIPFVGKSGELQDIYLVQNRMHRRRVYMTNLVKRHIPGNGNPTLDDIREFEQELVDEIRRVRPKFIMAIGAYSTRWFLPGADMEVVHGMPYKSDRAPGATVIPCYHPAYGLRDADANTLVWYDYQQAAKIIRGDIPSTPVEDGYLFPVYVDADSGVAIGHRDPLHMAIDTEGIPGHPWGFSVSFQPGSGTVFRVGTPEFSRGVGMITEAVRALNIPVIMHNSMYDIQMLREMGVDLRGWRIFDTMIAAFFLRVEPQALKTLARRHCGMVMRDYNEVIGDTATEKQIAYLVQVIEHTQDWPKPDARIEYENDGTTRLYKPQSVRQRAEAILQDWGQKREETDLQKRWHKVDKQIRLEVEHDLGPMPHATLDDIPLDKAVAYSGRDPDATLRLYYRLLPMIQAAKLSDRLQLDMDIIPLFEEMQSTGLMADRGHFEGLSEDMWNRMMSVGNRISNRYNDGQPFNPGSAPQVAKLAAQRRLKGAKKTKTGKVSTSKKSMEHLRRVDEAMDQIFTWREFQKIRDSFCTPIIERIPDGLTEYPITCNIKLTRVASDRISASNPNLTAQPASELGVMLRKGFGPTRPEGADPGQYLLGTADLSQIEMRVMAHLSGDPLLCKLFKDGRDIHKETAALIFHVLLENVDKMRHRNPTKRAGFGVITGIQGEGLLDQLRMMGCEGWTVSREFSDGQSDCVSEWCPAGIIHEWFRIYPGVKRYLRACGDKCETDGMVSEMGGFPRYLPGVYSNDPYVKAEARRQSHSHIIQGSAQWMLRRAMRWLKPQLESLRDDTGLYLRWVLQVHDELIFAFDKELLEPLRALVLEAMTEHSYKLKVPVEANWASAPTWGELDK